LIGGLHAEVVSSDRFILKILDRTVSFQDIKFQLRNLKALNCVYDDAFVIKFFDKSFIKSLDKFVADMPSEDEAARRHLHQNEALLKKLRHFFKMLRYSEDQKTEVNENLNKLIRESTRENRCDSEVLYKDTLKTNFIALMEMELYLRTRYGGQLKNNSKFDSIKQSIDLFVESLDKQFAHEYYW
jgi:ribosome-associated translation inhibitor RaiA